MPDRSPLPPHARPVLLVAAVDVELAPLIRRLGLTPAERNLWTTGDSSRADLRLLAAVTGMGAQRTVERVTALLDRYQPAALVHLGFAGALDPALKAGDIPPLTCVIDGHHGALRIAPGQAPVACPLDQLPPAAQVLLTSSQVVTSPAEKAQLHQQHRAGAVDMETYPVAELARQCDLPLFALRAISDPADTALPAASAHWITPEGQSNLAAVLKDLALHPHWLPTLLKLGRTSKVASRSLCNAFMTDVLPRLASDADAKLQP